jgi:hypothetical protein
VKSLTPFIATTILNDPRYCPTSLYDQTTNITTIATFLILLLNKSSIVVITIVPRAMVAVPVIITIVPALWYIAISISTISFDTVV